MITAIIGAIYIVAVVTSIGKLVINIRQRYE